MQVLGDVLFGLFGLTTLIGIAFLFSNNKRAVNWKLVLTGVSLQILFAVFASKSVRVLLFYMQEKSNCSIIIISRSKV